MNAGLPINGDVLVVDDEPLVGQFLVNQISRTGRVCHLVDSYESALLELEHHPSIRLVIIDHGIQPSGLPAFVARVRDKHADTMLVGSSGRDCPEEFSAAGVPRFLQKPWTTSQLCEELLRPAPFDSAQATVADASLAALTPGVNVGDRCRPICDTLSALDGIVTARRASGRVTIRLGGRRMKGVLLEIDADAVAHVV